MKKAIIQTGGKQYLVSEGETLKVELIKAAKAAPAKAGAKTAAGTAKPAANGKKLEFEPLLVIDGDKTEIGTPAVTKVKVTAEVVEADVQADKVTSIRYKAKKRVRTVRGHRQHQTILKIDKII